MQGIYLIALVFMLIGWAVQVQLRRKFKEYSEIPLAAGLTGREVAEKMLRAHGITDVRVMSVEGQLTDHYNPLKKTLNLSPDVYNGNNAAAAAVAAHECGHAVQHATAYAWLQLRSTLVPVVSVTSNIVQWVLLAGIIFINTFPNLLLMGIVMFTLVALFAFITLPVEFDASRRGLAWLESSGITSTLEHEKAKDALWWAAMTYVVSALATLTTLFYYLMIYLRRRN